MTGKWKKVLGAGGRGQGKKWFSPTPDTRHPASGFTLLELMIVISILVILAMIGIAQYQKTVLAAKEVNWTSPIWWRFPE